MPIPGDYDGDGSCDVGIFRELVGLWAIRDLTRVYFGGSGDRLVPGDYSGGGISFIFLTSLTRNFDQMVASRDLSGENMRALKGAATSLTE